MQIEESNPENLIYNQTYLVYYNEKHNYIARFLEYIYDDDEYNYSNDICMNFHRVIVDNEAQSDVYGIYFNPEPEFVMCHNSHRPLYKFYQLNLISNTMNNELIQKQQQYKRRQTLSTMLTVRRVICRLPRDLQTHVLQFVPKLL